MELRLHYILFFFYSISWSQQPNHKIDSLRTEINKYEDYDTSKIINILYLAKEVSQINTDQELELYKEAYRQSEQIKHPYLFVRSAQDLAVCYYYQGNYEMAKEFLENALQVARKNRLPQLSAVLLDLGEIADVLDQPKQSLEYTLEGIGIAESKKDYEVMLSGYNNLAAQYYYRNHLKKALAYYEKARNIAYRHLDINKHYNSLAIVEANIGWCHYYMGNLDKAIEQLKKAVEIHKKYENFSSSSCNTRNSLALFYIEKKKYDLASLYCNEALSIAHELNYTEGQASCYTTLGNIHFDQKNYSEALKDYEKSLKLYKELGNLNKMSNNSENIAKCYSLIGNHQEAFEFMETSKYYSDSLTKLESEAAFEDALTKYETEKKEAENTLLQEQAKLKDAEIEQQRITTQAKEEKQLIIASGIAVLLIAILFFFINRNRLKTRKNKELALQRDEIAEQKKEITDSINYARRIQNSFLPSDEDFRIQFNEYFLMYEPKDIVAGDFYILEEANDNIFFAVADCTGHGVPGAMVSIVCSNALRKVIHEDELVDPAEILAETRNIVIHQFARKGHLVKDGMDITFCTYNKKSGKLLWAGANNPLWILRKGEEVLEEIKPDKQPIGRYLTNDPFTSHEVHLGSGDLIYLITDGYPDQFGGPKGKKFKYKALKKFLIEKRNMELSDQLQVLETTFHEWKGEMEQVDDVCILGIKF
ncbi:MAG: tetratricopeptide repeat protein [Crocinitomicaceae bacterium]